MLPEEIRLPKEILQELKKIKNERYVTSYSQKTFNDIFIPWLTQDDKLEREVSEISATFVVSTFILDYLKKVNADLKIKYNIPTLNANELSDEEKFRLVSSQIIEIENEPSFLWLKNECIPLLNKILKEISVSNLDELVELGLIEDILTASLSEGKKNSVKDYYLETIYQLKDRLAEADLLMDKRDVIINNNLIINKYFVDGNTEDLIVDEDSTVNDKEVSKKDLRRELHEII
jgi:hypothetical protein